MRDKIGLIAVLLTAMVVPCAATTITVGGTSLVNQGQVSSVAGVTTVDFNTLSNGGPQSLTVGIASYSNLFIRSGATPDIEGDSSPFADPNATIGDLTINFSQPIVYFGLYWGSPDPLNTINFFDGATLVFTYTGQNLHDQLGVALGDGNAAYANFTAGVGESYTRVVLSPAGSFPFEDDNQAFLQAAPEVSTNILTVFGLALALVAQRRRTKT
jgi:hypothetical protein